MKINGLCQKKSLTVRDIPVGHLFRVKETNGGSIGYRMETGYVYICGGASSGSLFGKASVKYWDLHSTHELYSFEVEDLGRLVKIDEVTVE